MNKERREHKSKDTDTRQKRYEKARRRSNNPTKESVHLRTKSFSFHRNAKLFALSLLLALTSVSFLILPSYYDVTAGGSSHETNNANSETNWSKRKRYDVHISRATPLDQNTDAFLRTGKTPIKSSHTSQKSFDGNINAKPRRAAAHRRKQNRLVHGKLSLAEMNGWPPLDELIDKNGEIAVHEDISWLLDFAIIGFAKTGTTSMLRHLSTITHVLPTENCELTKNGTAKLLKDFYADRNRRLESAERNGQAFENQLRGFKCPQDVSSEFSLHNYAKHFPNAKLIVGIRHPVFWFESLYNFRVSNVPWKKMPHTKMLKKGCTWGSQGVCAHRASFADFLSQLGKTAMSSSDELGLLGMGLGTVKTPVGKVFLYEVSQLSEGEGGGGRSTQFRRDLKSFLGLSVDIPPFPEIDTSGRYNFLEPVKKQTEKDMINICGADHDEIRGVLMEKAKTSALWIRKYFLESQDVFVSSRDHFLDILEGWNRDPCLKA